MRPRRCARRRTSRLSGCRSRNFSDAHDFVSEDDLGFTISNCLPIRRRRRARRARVRSVTSRPTHDVVERCDASRARAPRAGYFQAQRRVVLDRVERDDERDDAVVPTGDEPGVRRARDDRQGARVRVVRVERDRCAGKRCAKFASLVRGRGRLAPARRVARERVVSIANVSTPVRSTRSSDRRTPRTQTDGRARASRTTTGYATTAVNSGSIARAVKTPAHTIDYDVSNHTVARAGDPDKRAFTYFVMTGGRMIYASALRLAVLKFLLSMSATADVLALASLEVDLSKVELGSTVTVKWRGKPVFIRRRTPAEIAKEESVDVASLRDPQADSERAPNQEWLVAVGVCTHLGCVPIANAGDYNGWFCPCHGSHYDASGRIRKGPAPENLEIPEYKFLDGDKMLIG